MGGKCWLDFWLTDAFRFTDNQEIAQLQLMREHMGRQK